MKGHGEGRARVPVGPPYSARARRPSCRTHLVRVSVTVRVRVKVRVRVRIRVRVRVKVRVRVRVRVRVKVSVRVRVRERVRGMVMDRVRDTVRVRASYRTHRRRAGPQPPWRCHGTPRAPPPERAQSNRGAARRSPWRASRHPAWAPARYGEICGDLWRSRET